MYPPGQAFRVGVTRLPRERPRHVFEHNVVSCSEKYYRMHVETTHTLTHEGFNENHLLSHAKSMLLRDQYIGVGGTRALALLIILLDCFCS